MSFGKTAMHRMPPTRTSIVLILSAALLVVIGIYQLQSHEVRSAILRTDPDKILDEPALAKVALSVGKRVFSENCSQCHGAKGESDPAWGVPDLTDNTFLYGDDSVSGIQTIVLHGIRSGDTKGWDLAQMPAYSQRIPYSREPLPPLQPGNIDDIIAYLQSANGKPADPAAAERGRRLYSGNAACWDCHLGDAKGDTSIGAPNLIDGKWLYGHGTKADIFHTIAYGRHGVSPAFHLKLDAFDALAVAVYTASLHPRKSKAD